MLHITIKISKGMIQMSEETHDSRRDALKKVALFAIPTMVTFHLSALKVAASSTSGKGDGHGGRGDGHGGRGNGHGNGHGNGQGNHGNGQGNGGGNGTGNEGNGKGPGKHGW